MAQHFSDHTMRQTAQWASWFARDWRMEIPTKIHCRDVAPDGSPQWHPDFEKWLTRDETFRQGPKNGEQRLRTTKVMRRLRRVAVREYEVLYRVLVLGERLEDTTAWLNARALRNDIPLPEGREVHYTPKDTMALIIAGIDFAKQYW